MFWNSLREFPGTPAKIFAGIVCELLYVIVILACIVGNRLVPLDLAIALGSVVLAFNGVTTWQFNAQRKTDYGYVERQSQGPSPVTVEAPAQVNVTQERPTQAPAVQIEPTAVQPLVSTQPRTITPLTHRESEKD